MKLWSALSNAAAGWVLILRKAPDWRQRFAISQPGLATALVIFVFMTFLAVALTSLSIGMPSLFGVVAAMCALALPLLALVVVLFGTRRAVESTESALDVLVPGTYLLTAFLPVEGVLAMIGGPVVMLTWLVLGYGLYRLARAATGWNHALAIGFAVLTVVLLVAIRLALYMLTSIAPPPI